MPISTQYAVSDLEFNSSLCDAKGCVHSFHNTRSSHSNCLSESRGNNVQIPGPYTRSPESESILGLRVRVVVVADKYVWESILKVQVNLMINQVCEVYTVYILHILGVFKEQESSDEKGTCAIIHLAVVFIVHWRTTALG